MSELVLGLDQGTSSTRCVVLDGELRELGACSIPVASAVPAPGPGRAGPRGAGAARPSGRWPARSRRRGRGRRDAAALGVANQTETFVVWDRATGSPIHPAIVWQDRRTDRECAALGDHEALVRARTGLELDATFPATKLAWVLDHVEGARAAAEDGRLAYGDVAAWLLQRLAGVHVSDAHNAGRSLLCGLESGDWDDELLALFGVPRALLPPVVDSDALDAEIGGMPVRAATGDQPASLFGLRCWEAGTAKVTLGTGAFVLAQAGGHPPSPPAGILASCAWRRAGAPSFELEGFIPTAGAAADWFARHRRAAPGPRARPAAGERHAGRGLRPGAAGAGLAGLGGRRARRRARAEPGHDARGPRPGRDGRHPAPGRRRRRGDGPGRAARRRCGSTAGCRARTGSRSGSPTSPACASSAPPAPTRPPWAPPPWRASPRACGASPTALPAVPLDLVAEPSLAPAARAAERDRWAEARAVAIGWPGR